MFAVAVRSFLPEQRKWFERIHVAFIIILLPQSLITSSSNGSGIESASSIVGRVAEIGCQAKFQCAQKAVRKNVQT